MPPNAIAVSSGGAEVAIASMDDYSRRSIGRSTYQMVQRLMRNPVYREMIQKKAAEMRLQNEGRLSK